MKSGLRKVTKTVRGKKGSVRRSYWVKAKEGALSLVRAHGKKVLAGAALAGAAALAYKHRGSFSNDNLWKTRVSFDEHKSKAQRSWKKFRRGAGARLAEHLVNTAGDRIVDYAAERAGRSAGSFGKKHGGKYGKKVARFVVSESVSFMGHEAAKPHVARAGKFAARAVRGTNARKSFGSNKIRK